MYFNYRRPGPPPAPLRGSGGVPNVEGNTILVSYLETCLRHIQEAILSFFENFYFIFFIKKIFY